MLSFALIMSQSLDNSGEFPRPTEQMPSEIIQHQCDSIFGAVQELLEILDFDPDENYTIEAALYFIEDDDGTFEFISAADSDPTMSFGEGDKVTVMIVGVDSCREVIDDDLYYVRLYEPVAVTNDHLDPSTNQGTDELVPRSGWERFSAEVTKAKSLLLSQEAIEGTYDKETIIRSVADGTAEVLFDSERTLISPAVLASVNESLQSMLADEKHGSEIAQARAAV